MPNTSQSIASRRSFLSTAALGGLSLATLAGCNSETAAAGKENRLRAACGNAGLKTSWCSQGKKAMELWGELLNVEIVWLDGELDSTKQAKNISLRANEDWDFACFQPNEVGSLVEAVKPFAERNIPLITMDVTLTEEPGMRDAGAWCHVSADQEFMGATSTRYLMQKIGGKGKVIHIGGRSNHSGAQGRQRGFDSVLAEFPEVEVVGGGIRWCNWEKDLALSTFNGILQQFSNDPIAGCFCHSDDMALACATALKGTVHENMVITSVDGQKDGLEGVETGLIAATTINPVSLIHMTSLAIGQFIVRNNELKENIPAKIITPGPLVSRESDNLSAMKFMADPRHCMV